MRILAVNNYPTEERFRRLVRGLEAAGARVAKSRWSDSSAKRFNSFDGVVLSGSPDMLSSESAQRKYAVEVESIRGASVPLLGICFGHQLIGSAFGSRVVRGSHVLKYVETEILAPDPLFTGLPGRALVLESHDELVDRLPEGFSLLAKSKTSPIAAMKHSRRQIYGLQFHPERNSRARPDGSRILSNFVGGLS